MEGIIFLAADVFSEQVKEATEGRSFHTRDVLLGVTAVLFVAFALFAWIYFRTRRRADVVDRERISQMTQSITAPKPEEKKGGKGERRRKRRRRRDHRPRNPSLEKTGGLPPPRPDDQLPKY